MKQVFKQFIMCVALFAMIAKVFMPLIAILFFAVSPIDALFGSKAHHLTSTNSYICNMGIEWKGDAKNILQKMGMGHSADMAGMQHHQNHQNHDNSPDKNSDSGCLIEASYYLASILFLGFIAFVASTIFRKIFIYIPLYTEPIRNKNLFYSFPLKQAPPVF